MRRRLVMAVIVLLAALAANYPVQAATQTPTPQAPATQGNQPAPPGPAQETAQEPAPQTPPRQWEQVPIPPLPAFHPAVPKRIALPNGMILFLQEDHELPLISATARIHSGSRLEPAAKAGLVGIFGAVGVPAAPRPKPATRWTIFWKLAPPNWKPAAMSNPFPSLSIA